MTPATIIHALLVASDQLELVADELPRLAEPQAIMLTALARAAVLTAEKLKAEAGEKERTLMGVVG